MRKFWFIAFLLSLFVPGLLMAGKLTLKDGTVYEGTIKKLGSSYTVKLADGTMKLVSGSEVAGIDDPTLAAPPAGTSTAGTAGGTPTAGGKPGVVTPGGGADFDRTARQADRVDTPLVAVTLWQKFVDTHPSAADQEAGKKELTKWQDWSKKGAERVNGKWVVGDDLKKLRKDVNKLWEGYLSGVTGNKTLNGTKKLEEILKIYPNHFPANFELGYVYLIKITRVEGANAEIDKSIKSLETAVKINPKSAESLSNLAIAYNFRRRYEESAITAYKAAQIKDTPDIVQNLISALSYAPPGMRTNNPKVKPIVDEAALLASRHNVSGKSGWIYVRPRFGENKGGDDDDDDGPSRKGMVGSGTGFFVSADGYIMTNRHVASAGDKLIVRLSDGTMKTAEKIVVDDEQDIAIIKIDTVKKDKKEDYPFIRIATYDVPNNGADVTVMGFPLGSSIGMNVKITRGVVTGIEDDPKSPCDVLVDAQVNPGNSGGPMLDKFGNVLALVAMKTGSDERVSSYGLGIGPGRLRKFMEHQKEKLTPVKFLAAEKAAPTAALSTEEIAGKFTKATVMILMYSGDLPEGLK